MSKPKLKSFLVRYTDTCVREVRIEAIDADDARERWESGLFDATAECVDTVDETFVSVKPEPE